MAGKNEIKHRLSLEGDDDVKARLKSVGETGKQSLGDIEKSFGLAGNSGEKFAEKLTRPLTQLRRAFAPFLEEAGINAIAEGGVIGRLFGLGGPAAAVAAAGAIALHLARVSEETKKTKASLKAFGDTDDGLDKLTERAKKLGTSADSLVHSRESALSYNRDIAAANPNVSHPPGYQEPDDANQVRIVGGGKDQSPVNLSAHNKATDALIRETQIDNKEGLAAGIAAVNKFQDAYLKNGLTADIVKELAGFSKTAANFVGSSLSQKLGQDTGTSEKLIGAINRNGPVSARSVDDEVAKRSGTAEADAAAARGVGGAFENLKATTGRLDEALGKLAGGAANKASASALDKVSGAVAKATDIIEDHSKQIQDDAATGYNIGKKVPFVGPLTGVIGGGIGAGVGALSGAAEEVEKLLPKTVPYEALTDFLKGNAVEDRGPRHRLSPGEAPPQFQPPQPTEQHSEAEPHASAEHSGPPSLAQVRKMMRERTSDSEIPDIDSVPKGTIDTFLSNTFKLIKGGLTAPGAALASDKPVTTEQLIAPSRDIASIAVGGANVQAVVKEVIKSLATVASETVGPEARKAAIPEASAGELHAAPPQAAPPVATPQPGEQHAQAEQGGAQNVAALDSAAGAAAEGLQQVASAAPAAASNLNGKSGDEPATVQAAGGGEIGVTGTTSKKRAVRRFADGGITGDPFLGDIMRDQQEQDEEAARRQAKIKASLHKSQFVGKFGSHSVYEDSISHFATGGGDVRGPGTSTSDDIPAYLSHGEFVVNARETGCNRRVLNSINAGKFPDHIAKMFASGGVVDLPGIGFSGPMSGISSFGFGRAPIASDLGDFGGGLGNMLGHYTVDMRTHLGDFSMMAPETTMRQMSRAAVAATAVQAGPRPSWYAQ